MEIRLVEDDLLHADTLSDGQTDRQDEAVIFRNFANAPNNGTRLS